ncbi:trifunctional dihydropteroate synthetase [Phlyctochytrium bullatum]|nr:trifunctional dihydropteroate synthetase [Phlyctochytrium bullatum]
MDQIEISNLQVRNTIGVDSWERSKKQPINITLTLHTDIAASGDTDILSASVHYGLVTKAVQKFAETASVRSIEALAVGIIKTCVLDFKLDRVSVRVVKPKGLLHATAAGIEMTRTKTDIEALVALQKDSPKQNFRKRVAEDDEVGSDVIFIEGLTLSTIIGVNAWERVEKQRVIVDIKLHLKLKPQSLLGDVVPKVHNYRTIARLVTEKVEASNFKTVEALVTTIAKLLIIDCHAPKVSVKVRKPSALVFADSAGILIERDRSFFTQEINAKQQDSKERADLSPSIHTAYIAIGSNLGDRLANLQNAIEALAKFSNIKVLDTSFLYETAPMYVKDQPSFLNAVFKLLALLSHSEDYVPDTIVRVFPARDTTLWPLVSRTYIMGILNVTPDSFSDGGKFYSPERAVEHVEKMIKDGADIIDIGGQSTRPNAEEVPTEEEIQRVVPIIKEIRAKGLQVPISVDTYRADVAKAAVAAGADIINDVSGGLLDARMIATAADLKVPICLMHMRGTPKTMTKLTQYDNDDVVASVRRDLMDRVNVAINEGVFRWNVFIDPGIGFAKTPAQSFELIRSLRSLTTIGANSINIPVLVGPSRKSFLNAGLPSQKQPEERVWGTAAACTASVAGGATFLRVHDVAEMRDVINIADTLYRPQPRT